MEYAIIAIVGALVGFVAGKSLRAKRHGSWVDVIPGLIGGFGAILAARAYIPGLVQGWPITIGVVVAGAFIATFIVLQFAISKPPPSQQGRFRR